MWIVIIICRLSLIQTKCCFLQSQSGNGKYNLILVNLTRIKSKYVCVYISNIEKYIHITNFQLYIIIVNFQVYILINTLKDRDIFYR